MAKDTQIIEQNGIKFEKPKLKEELATLSLRGNDISFGSILPTPDKIFQKLGKMQRNVYSQLLTDPFLRGLIQSRKSGTLQLDYEILTNDVDAKIVEAVDKLLDRIDLHDLSSAILDAPLYGYQPIELVWDIVDNLAMPIMIDAKPFHWFGFNKEGKLVYKKDDYDENGQQVLEVKFLVPRNEPTYDNPYGTPLLSYCYWNIYFKTKGFEFWAEFAEKFGSPSLLLQYGNDADEDILEDLYTSMVNQVNSGVVTMPKKYEVQMLNGANGSSVNIFQSLIENSKKELEVLILGHDSSASSEAGKLGNNNQTVDVNQRIINTDKRLVQKTVNKLIRYFVTWNFGSQAFYPEFAYKQSEDLRADRVDRDVKALQLNPNLIFNTKYFEEILNIPSEYLDEVVHVGGAGNPPLGKSNANMSATSPEIPNRYKPYFQRTVFMAEEFEDQKLADKFIDDVLLKLDNDSMFGDIIDDIYKVSARYNDLNSLLDNYDVAYDKIDLKPFMDVIERAVFVIYLLGWHYSAEEQEVIEQVGYIQYTPTMKTSITLKDLIFAFGEKPKDAIKYFKSKGYRVSKNAEEYIKAVQDHAFTVAGVTKMSILKDFKDLILKGLENEISISEFRKEMKARLGDYGWQNSKLATNHRLNNIYRTNVQESINIARTDQMQSVKSYFPYVQNVDVIDKVTTENCKFLNGKIFSQDDKEFFNNFAPMGHYGCRRRIRAVSQRMFDNMKLGLYKSNMAIVQKHINGDGFTNKNKPYSPNLSDFPKELAKRFKKAQ